MHQFLDPRPQTGIIRPPVTALTAENTDQFASRSSANIVNVPGLVAAFRGSHRSDRLRISVGFNIMSPPMPRSSHGRCGRPDDVRPFDRPPPSSTGFHRRKPAIRSSPLSHRRKNLHGKLLRLKVSDVTATRARAEVRVKARRCH